MIRNIRTSALAITVCLAVPTGFAVTPVYAEEDAMESAPQAVQSEFVYHDDWAIVSAPPPPGPYNPVHLDPRIPGQEGNVRSQLSLQRAPAITAERIIDDMTSEPPAAGQPAIEARPPARAARQVPYSAPPVHYGYGRLPPRFQTPWSAGSYPPSFPPTGWAGSGPGVFEEEVPPPPVYDRMTRPPSGPFGNRSGRY